MSTNNTPITMIKMGGSLITDKNKPSFIKSEPLREIAGQVREIVDMGMPIILSHGAGSFGHVPAQKYQTHLGMISKQSKRGVVEVSAAMRELNLIVMRELIAAGVPAVSIAPASCMTAHNHELGTLTTRPIELLLERGFVPVLFGDQVLDDVVGSAVFPTERVLAYVGLELQKRGVTIGKIIHCSHVGGVFDLEGSLIPEISPTTLHLYEHAISGSQGVDVSGGMLQKVRETLDLAKQGIPGLIIDGLNGGLVAAVLGRDVRGTRIVA